MERNRYQTERTQNICMLSLCIKDRQIYFAHLQVDTAYG